MTQGLALLTEELREVIDYPVKDRLTTAGVHRLSGSMALRHNVVAASGHKAVEQPVSTKGGCEFMLHVNPWLTYKA